MTKKTFYNTTLLLMPYIILLSSCVLQDSLLNGLGTQQCPCVINAPLMQLGNIPGSYSLAGIYVDVINCTEKEISALEVFFLCTEPDGTRADLCGSNPVKAKAEITFIPGERKTLIISLDRKLTQIPKQVWELDPFLVSAVIFSDGTIWRDASVLTLP